MQMWPPLDDKGPEQHQIGNNGNTTTSPNGNKRAHESSDLDKNIPPNDTLGVERD